MSVTAVDPAYESVAPNDFAAMLAIERYETRSTAFDRLIRATHAHYWDPGDPAYIDFSTPFDLENEALASEAMVIPLYSPHAAARLAEPKTRIRFVNQYFLRSFSSILHGEQGAMSLSASLCHLLKDQGAQEYAANQAREEARHVAAFSRYIKTRWGRPTACGPTLQSLLIELVETDELYKKIVGMQILVEGLAMGTFAGFYQNLRDPVGRRLMQLVMADEAFHHRFGKIWADRTMALLTEPERNMVEDWSAHCFELLLNNLTAPVEYKDLFDAFDVDFETTAAELRAMATKAQRRKNLSDPTNIYRVLIKTLWNARIITERTRSYYADYVDFDLLRAEGETMVGDDIAAEGLTYLQGVNTSRQAQRRPAQAAASPLPWPSSSTS